MTSENKQPCDIDDIVCQMEVLRHLKGLEEQLGREKFLEKYPELDSLKERLPSEIAQQQQVVNSGIQECGEKEETLPAEVAAAEEEPEASTEEE